MREDSEYPVPPTDDHEEPVSAGAAQGSSPAEFRSAGQSLENGSEGLLSAEAERRKKPERNGLVEALTLVVVAFLLAFTLKSYVAEAYEIKGRSMEPTFGNGQRVVVLKAFYGLERGDIIVFSSVEDPGKDLIKRIVGLPGELIEIRSGKVYVDGVRLDEEYVFYPDKSRTTKRRVPEECYFVLGDNRPDSHDSRYFKAVPADHVKGKVLIRWWPFNEFRSF